MKLGPRRYSAHYAEYIDKLSSKAFPPLPEIVHPIYCKPVGHNIHFLGRTVSVLLHSTIVPDCTNPSYGYGECIWCHFRRRSSKRRWTQSSITGLQSTQKSLITEMNNYLIDQASELAHDSPGEYNQPRKQGITTPTQIVFVLFLVHQQTPSFCATSNPPPSSPLITILSLYYFYFCCVIRDGATCRPISAPRIQTPLAKAPLLHLRR